MCVIVLSFELKERPMNPLKIYLIYQNKISRIVFFKKLQLITLLFIVYLLYTKPFNGKRHFSLYVLHINRLFKTGHIINVTKFQNNIQNIDYNVLNNTLTMAKWLISQTKAILRYFIKLIKYLFPSWLMVPLNRPCRGTLP